MFLCSWGPADCWHYRQQQRCSDAVSPGTGLYSVLGAEILCLIRLKCYAARQAPQLARWQDGTVSTENYWGWSYCFYDVINTALHILLSPNTAGCALLFIGFFYRTR